jgi:hypothetical protein
VIGGPPVTIVEDQDGEFRIVLQAHRHVELEHPFPSGHGSEPNSNICGFTDAPYPLWRAGRASMMPVRPCPGAPDCPTQHSQRTSITVLQRMPRWSRSWCFVGHSGEPAGRG